MAQSFLDLLKTDAELSECLVSWQVQPAAPGAFAPLPRACHPALAEVLRRRGIERLYLHQARAMEAIAARSHLIVATPTASGKSLCYNLPVLSAMLDADPADRPSALYLFPTKALSQDQVAELHAFIAELEDGDLQASMTPNGAPPPFSHPIASFTYDGDTPAESRRVLRDRGDIIVTNPYMLHVAILPNHMRWGRFFRRLRYVVIDELHVYRGIFGSSVADVIRRLRRIARHYESDPVFIASSATIRDPAAHFERLVEETPTLIHQSGAPRAERHHIFYNPPVVNHALGLRARAVDEARRLCRHLLRLGVPSILFARSRNAVEVLTKYLKDAAREIGVRDEQVVGYRGGYLPKLRRQIERGLRSGEIRMVAATNALELGVDIGSLDAVVMCGYPGSVASYQQQAGRAGRRSGRSAVVLVASSAPLDQYVLAEPDFLLRGPGEEMVSDPDNLVIATNHLKCAAFELPFREDDGFGRFPHTRAVLEALALPGGVLLERDGRFHWMAEVYPAESVSLDALEMDTFIILEQDSGKSLGHVDRLQAMTTIHPQAIYQHQGAQYQIMELDWEGRRAYAKRVRVDYYTQAETQTDIQVLHRENHQSLGDVEAGFGDIHVTQLATFWKRIRFYTNENLETGPIQLPPEEMDTTGFWIVLNELFLAKARLRDGARSGALAGMAQLFRGVAPVFLRLGRRDLRGGAFAMHAHFKKPAIILYDAVPGGVGLARQLFEIRNELYLAALQTVRKCPCRLGCPGCIGLGGERGAAAKHGVRDALELLLEEEKRQPWPPTREVSWAT